MKRTEFYNAALREIADWPSVSYRHEDGSKHPRLHLTYRGVTRFVMLPTTPGDVRRGVKIKLCEIRRTLRDLGAERTPRNAPKRSLQEFECAARP